MSGIFMALFVASPPLVITISAPPFSDYSLGDVGFAGA
jgi:hypothetical protein